MFKTSLAKLDTRLVVFVIMLAMFLLGAGAPGATGI